MRTLLKLFMWVFGFTMLLMVLGSMSELNSRSRSTAPRVDPVGPPAPPPRGSNWLKVHDVDPMTSQASVTLAAASKNKERARFGRMQGASLFVACRNNKTEVFMDIADFISNQPVPVMTRVDEKPPQTRDWDVSTNFESVFAPRAIALARELESAERFQVRLVPHGSSPRTFDFDVSGLDVHLPVLRKACNW